mgnify:CR=1 FL=1
MGRSVPRLLKTVSEVRDIWFKEETRAEVEEREAEVEKLREAQALERAGKQGELSYNAARQQESELAEQQQKRLDDDLMSGGSVAKPGSGPRTADEIRAAYGRPALSEVSVRPQHVRTGR